MTLTLGVQWFGISFKLMLIHMYWSILTRSKYPNMSPTMSSWWEWWCRIAHCVAICQLHGFSSYIHSVSKMVPLGYESTCLICITFHVWICIWNVWLEWGILVLWNAIVYKYILYLYDFLNVLNLLWHVSHSPSVCLVCVWVECHPSRWVSIKLWWWCYHERFRSPLYINIKVKGLIIKV